MRVSFMNCVTSEHYTSGTCNVDWKLPLIFVRFITTASRYFDQRKTVTGRTSYENCATVAVILEILIRGLY
jgi:hypothetical protein